MTTRTKLIIVITYTALCVAIGRYSTPERIKIETKTVEVASKDDDKKIDSKISDHKKIQVVEIDKPTGEKNITTTITDDADTDTTVDNKEKDTSAKTSAAVKEETKGDSKVTISALGGYDLRLNQVVYGASVSKPILGPITVGAWFLTQPSAGVSLGLQF